MGSIKDRAAVIGMGCTKFGERWDAEAEQFKERQGFLHVGDPAALMSTLQKAGWRRPPSLDYRSSLRWFTKTEQIALLPAMRAGLIQILLADKLGTVCGLECEPQQGLVVIRQRCEFGVVARSTHRGQVQAELEQDLFVDVGGICASRLPGDQVTNHAGEFR